VTIGNVSGTVTRIRIRATTVLDWDNKELIVPNRDFVTGNLVNWTLTNPNIRLVITVGLAFGSDTRLATRLLHEIAVANPLTLTDPEPVVLFSKIGNGNLEFELRVFVSGITNLRTLRHELHMAINDAFLEHNITVAFPQQDLHVRSVPDAWVHALAMAHNPDGSQASSTQTIPPETQSRKHVA
jgi:potassium efflux system protein